MLGRRKDGEVPAAGDASAPVSDIPSLPDLLVLKGGITHAQMQQALARQRETGAFLGEVLIEEGLLDEQSLISFLAKHCRIPHLSLLDYLIDATLLELIPKDICKQYRLLPIDKLGRNLTVAMVNPLDAEALQQVRALCPDLRIKPILCAHQHFVTVTARIFQEQRGGEPVSMSASSFGLKIDRAAVKAVTEETPPVPEPPKVETAAASPAPAPMTPAAASNDEVDPFSQAAATRSENPPAPAESAAAAQVFDGVFHRPENETQPTTEELVDSGLSQSGILMREMASVMMDSMRDTYAILARRMDLFRGVDPENVAKIFARGITHEYGPETTIFEKGTQGDLLYILLNGSVQIADGDRVIATLNRGDMFGEMALISEETRSATARSLTDVSLLALSQDIIRIQMPRDVSIQLLVNIVITLSARLRQANEA